MVNQQQLEIIKDVHEGVGQSTQAMASHRGKDSTYKNVESYTKSYENCHKQGELKLKRYSKLHSIPVPSNLMKQVGVDLCGLPEAAVYRYLIICIHYLNEWFRGKANNRQINSYYCPDFVRNDV